MGAHTTRFWATTLAVTTLAIGLGACGPWQPLGNQRARDMPGPLTTENLAAVEFGVGATLQSPWRTLRPDAIEIAANGANLTLTLRQPARWDALDQTAAVARFINGNMKLTATARAAPATTPRDGPQLAGILARDPNAPAGVGVVVGVAPTGAVLGSVVGQGSQWQFDTSATTAPQGDLRICRIGATFATLRRANADEPWQRVNQIDRPDLPGGLDVGVIAVGAPGLRVTFERVQLEGATNIGMCAQN